MVILDSWAECIFLFVLLVFGHGLADFCLQNDYVARYKSHKTACISGKIWPWVMFAHCATHALVVYAISGSFVASMIELVLHTCIDYTKCSGKINYHVDQTLHMVSKAIIVAILWYLALPIKPI